MPGSSRLVTAMIIAAVLFTQTATAQAGDLPELPPGKPMDFPHTVARLQSFLLAEAETFFGESSWTGDILPVQYRGMRPRIWLRRSRQDGPLDEVWFVLSQHAATRWSSLIYEMAHETVHLLDPSLGNSNVFEEGMAMAFSHHALRRFGFEPWASGTDYDSTLALVTKQTDDVLTLGGRARALADRFRDLDRTYLRQLLPRASRDDLDRLTTVFDSGAGAVDR